MGGINSIVLWSYFSVEPCFKEFHFLSNWLLVSGVISFGLSVALLGELYNSHTEVYVHI
jgi:hypothetical protein